MRDYAKSIAKMNRSYLSLIKEMAIMDGIKVTAKILGMEEASLRRLVEMEPKEIERVSSFGGLLVKVTLPEWDQSRYITLSRLLDERLPSPQDKLEGAK